ncbi:MAG: TetR/AcrR family transcriptional regulator [Firmicutes bacterium]|nr:TetR/AcrR family transcriptional regulator [Bacillota bacterium]
MRDRSKKRELIMEAALQVFVEHGYEKTKIIDVARTAGIGKGTVYEYFESKEELFCCILEEYCEYYKEAMKRILSEMTEAPCCDKLLAVIHMEDDLKNQVHLKSLNPIQLLTEFTNFPGLRQAIQEMLKFKFDAVCDILKEGVETGEFRPTNIPLATAALMGASSTLDMIVAQMGGAETGKEGADSLVNPEVLMDFTDENLLDLLIRGLKA